LPREPSAVSIAHARRRPIVGSPLWTIQVGPRFDEPVEFLELALGVGCRRTAFQPTQHVSFDQVARHARMLSVDALRGLLDR
jgi:hypothetical protein